MIKQQMVSETRGIGQLLNERRYFAVPRHQRDFAWPLGAVEQYLEDVVGAMSEADSDYFLGLIVLVNTDNPTEKRYEILDGQQRLATTTMILAAIRQWLRESGQDTEATKIQKDFIGISEIGEEQDEPRLILNVHNQDVFQETVVNPCSDKRLKELQSEAGRHTSVRKLLDAALRCREFVAELADNQGPDKKDQAVILFNLAKYLRDRVQVNCLDVTAPENAYTIFESLNDRGIALSVLDLLKNHILKEAGSNEDQILNNWSVMIARIGDRRADDFLKVFWTSRFGRIQRGRLFRELKKKYYTKAEALFLSKDLAEVAETYSNLEVSDSDLWKGYSNGCQESVRGLAILGARQTHPILLSAIAIFRPDQVEKLLKHLVTLIIRYQLICRGRTGRLETLSASVAEGIFSKRLKTLKMVWDQLRLIVPNDKEFEDDFSIYEENKPNRARWLLRELEQQQWIFDNPGQGVQNAPLTDPEKVNLEHILPKNPDPGWKNVLGADPSILRECRNRLGNLCLLDKPSNKKQAAKPFSDKKLLYLKSEFDLTKQVASQYSAWDRRTIEDRQRKMAKLALSRWPF